MNHSHRGSARRAPLLLAGVLLGCASANEEASWSDWERERLSFRPISEEPAPITSATTLDDYVRMALEGNPRLRARVHLWGAALERAPQARSLPDPTVTYGHFVEEVETRVGPQRNRVSVTQMLPWPGKLIYGSGVAVAEAEASHERYVAARLEVVYLVTRAYADYHYLARELAVTSETLALVQHWEAVARARLRAGVAAAHRDAIKAQVEIGRLEDRVETLRDARGPIVHRLNALLDRHGTDLPWPQTLPEPILARDDTAIYALLAASSPVLRERDRLIDARQRGVALARQSYFPDLALGFDYVDVGPARSSGVRGSGDDAVLARLGISLPIWIGRNRARVAEAEARMRAAIADRKARQNELEATVSRGLFTYRDAERKARLYRGSLVPKAKQSLEALAGAYEAGDGDFLDVLDAEQTLLEFHLAYERARANRLTALSELSKLVGVPLDRPAEESR